MGIVFEWDDKHARIIDEPDHSDAEDRYILLGVSIQSNILVVCHCYREPNDVIRIISARKATRKETSAYRKLT